MGHRLIFGTASLHRLATSRQRQRAIAAACDAGISAFDLAPAYGNGIDELEAGIALRSRRDDLELNTKYGIPVAIYGGLSRHVFAARRLADRVTGGSARAYRLRDFSPEEMVRSVDASLGRLRTDRVDCLFVHEPIAPLSAGEISDIVACGLKLKAAGKIRALGVAGTMDSVSLCPSLDGFDVLQTRYVDRAGLPSAFRDKPVILYGVHAAYREAPSGDFGQFVREALALREGLRVIVTSRRPETIATFGGLAA
jgi:aryl-alcohol dehydrogenase-like predicted oxidoreductase